MARAPAHSTPETALTPLPLHPSHPRCPMGRREHLAESTTKLFSPLGPFTPRARILTCACRGSSDTGLGSARRVERRCCVAGAWLLALHTRASSSSRGLTHPGRTLHPGSAHSQEEDTGLAAVSTPLVARPSQSLGVIT